MRYGPSVTRCLASAKMLNDLPSQRSTTNDSEAPIRISAVEKADKPGPRSVFGRKASAMHRKVPSKADIRGAIPLAFKIGANLVNVVDATKLMNMILAMLAAATSSLWRLSNGSRRGIAARPTHASAANTITIVALAALSSQGLTV